MLYNEIKKLLNNNGFELEYTQTCGILDTLEFINPSIEGSVYIEFGDDLKLPEDIKNGKCFSYDDDWLLDLPIARVEFDIDMSISYMSEQLLDTYGASDMNKIILYGEDLELTEQVFILLSNPYEFLKFQKTYAVRLTEFIDFVSKFTPIFEKHKLKMSVYKTSGNINTLYPSLSIQFGRDPFVYVDFYFTTLKWGKRITLQNINDTIDIDLNISTEKLEKEIDAEISNANNLLKLIHEKQRSKV